MHTPHCSIIILSYNQLSYTKQCLESIRRYTRDIEYEIIIVDNASNAETIQYLDTIEDIILLKNPSNMGFAGGCNQGIAIAKGDYILLLNNDTIVTHRWLFNMVTYLEEHREIDMIGPLTNATVGKQMIQVPYNDDLEQMQEFASTIAESDASAWHTLRLVAFCLLLRRSLIDEIGIFDTGFAIGNYEDDDYNIRALCAGKKAVICRNSFIHHFMNVSFTHKDINREQIMMTNKLRLEDKWQGMNWNHHAVCNQYVLNKILEQDGRQILQIGCGLGALAIELKDKQPAMYVVGIEDHPIRRQIAARFLDEVYEENQDSHVIEMLVETHRRFDSILIECMIEKLGLTLLEKIKPLLKPNTQILLRVFNIRHITTMERLVTGEVGGRLLCASSQEFTYHYGAEIKAQIEAQGYIIREVQEVKKTLSAVQEDLLTGFNEYPKYQIDARVYNRIYCITYAER
ncbi:MAG: glycosyltransferase [Lachnospiraceae bacterium]